MSQKIYTTKFSNIWEDLDQWKHCKTGGKGKRRDRKPKPGRCLHNESVVLRIGGRSLICSCCNNAQTSFVLVCCITFQHCPGGSWMVSWNDIGRVSHFSQINHDIHQHFHLRKIKPKFLLPSPNTKSFQKLGHPYISDSSKSFWVQLTSTFSETHYWHAIPFENN